MTTAIESLQQFKETQLLTAQLLTQDLFDSQVSSIVNEFTTETENNFLRLLRLNRNITFVNQILTGLYKNFKFSILSSSSISIANPILIINSFKFLNSTCSCASDPQCKMVSAVYQYKNGVPVPIYIVTGFYISCFTIESLLISTLECFYDNTDCLSNIVNLYDNPALNITRLNSSPNASRFSINSTIGELFSELFIESWNPYSNYSSYFAQCQPVSCTYKSSRRNSLIETITRIVGLIGGLTISLRILVVLFMSAFRRFKRRRHQQEGMETNTSLKSYKIMTAQLP
ncbi:unnamed protein product [Adineta steineri]|uniref:Uncharacterized protein n=1 Tax=Adineta steineri TaxID=433720 RepID=A0A816FA19_9BILA|nr:unnamed protein product [Adineta steineri]CAF1657200.1 unnamed protein product [Adineta steineri]